MRVIDLSQNKLSEQAGIDFAQASKRLEALEEVHLRDNMFGQEAGEAWLMAVKEKRNLYKVCLEMNMIKYVTLKEIDKECHKNKKRFQVNLPLF